LLENQSRRIAMGKTIAFWFMIVFGLSIAFGGTFCMIYMDISKEIEHWEYGTLADNIKDDNQSKQAAREAMSDGYISKNEYGNILNEHTKRIREKNDKEAHQRFMESIK
jgi:hypothetical protein